MTNLAFNIYSDQKFLNSLGCRPDWGPVVRMRHNELSKAKVIDLPCSA